MRKVTAQILKAFNEGKCKTVGNTFCTQDAVYLHGNKIVKRENGKVFISIRGWNTQVTRERLNAFTNKRVSTKNWQLMLDGQPWDGDWTEA